MGTAGLETSALALGQARAALAALVGLAAERVELSDPVDVLCDTWAQTWASLMACARGDENALPATEVRARANALVVRSDPGVPDRPPRQRFPSIRARAAVGPSGPLLPRLVVPDARSPRRRSETWRGSARLDDRSTRPYYRRRLTPRKDAGRSFFQAFRGSGKFALPDRRLDRPPQPLLERHGGLVAEHLPDSLQAGERVADVAGAGGLKDRLEIRCRRSGSAPRPDRAG